MIMSVGALAALCFVIATALAVANKYLQVDQDPRIDATFELLPKTNCGACGFPGCLGLAQAIVDGRALPGKCTVMTEDERNGLAAFLGIDAGVQEKVVARLACAGGTNVARNRASYTGLDSCRAASLIAGGGKGCFWGCLGLGDCETVCEFDAITMNEHALPVVSEADCTACGDCVEACPKDLFSLHPVSHRLWVACRNLQKGEAVLADCEVACDACGKCAVDAPRGVISMVNNLPIVDYSARHAAPEAIERCPTGAIVWFDEQRGTVTGNAARKILRHGARTGAPT